VIPLNPPNAADQEHTYARTTDSPPLDLPGQLRNESGRRQTRSNSEASTSLVIHHEVDAEKAKAGLDAVYDGLCCWERDMEEECVYTQVRFASRRSVVFATLL